MTEGHSQFKQLADAIGWETFHIEGVYTKAGKLRAEAHFNGGIVIDFEIDLNDMQSARVDKPMDFTALMGDFRRTAKDSVLRAVCLVYLYDEDGVSEIGKLYPTLVERFPRE